MFWYFFRKILFVILSMILVTGITYLITNLLRKSIKDQKRFRKIGVYFVDIISFLYIFWDIFFVYYFANVSYYQHFIDIPDTFLITMMIASVIIFSITFSFYLFLKQKKIWVSFIMLTNGIVSIITGTTLFWMFFNVSFV